MKRSTTYRIGELLGEYVKVQRFGEKLREVDALKCWEELLNPVFSRYCKEAHIQNGSLFVVITSPVVKAELQMMRESLRKELNARLGGEFILKIVFR
jgi:predicted nucleic acid-binding Zn ribbon protein